MAMRRRLLTTSLVALAITFAGASITHAAEPGVVLGAPDSSLLDRISASGAKHVRLFLSWRAMEPQPGQLSPSELASHDDFVNRAAAIGVRTYFVVVQTPAWASASGSATAPPPPNALADFAGRLAAHFRGRVAGYEMWNEPDATTFWQGSASPDAYATLLRSSYAAIKAADAGAAVGVGGLVGNDYGYLNSLYGAGAKGSFDFVAVHTDNGCNHEDPRVAMRDPNNGRVSRWSFTGYREVHQTTLDNGDDKPIWMSELGWAVTGAKCGVDPKQPAGVTATTQADFLTRAYACMAADPYMQMGSWFSLRDFGSALSAGAGLGLMDSNGVLRPAFAAFQRVAHGVAPDHGCGAQIDRNGPALSVAYPRDGASVSGDLVYRIVAGDDHYTKVALVVDGRQVRVTAKRVLKGRWTGWRKLALGPHTVVARAYDSAQNVSSQTMTINKVRYGDGEPIHSRIALHVYGSGPRRLAGAKLFPFPHEARPFMRGRLTIHFERRHGSKWLPRGSAAGTRVTGTVRQARRFKPGKYRVVVEYAGYKSFRRAVARRTFTVA